MDTIKILIDLSHNESITNIPENCLPDTEVLFEFVNPNDDLSDVNFLKRFNLLILGNPQPRASVSERNFTPIEVKTLKSYVQAGGSIFLTSGSKGDFDLPKSSGSIRVLQDLTGVQMFPNGILYMAKGRKFYLKNTNLLIDLFPKHPIFHDFNASDQIILGKCTYFILDLQNPPKILLETDPHTMYYAISKKYKDYIGKRPLCVLNTFGKGKVISLACSEILTMDAERGINRGSNRKFISSLLHYLIKHSRK